MSDYSPDTDFAAKDSLPSGNAAKIIKGSEFSAEFNNIATMSQTKADEASPTFTGTVTLPTVVAGTTTVTQLDLIDNKKIRIGTGQDLKLYHNGSNSYIEEAGTGNLRVLSSVFVVKNPADSETMIKATENDAVELYFDNGKKVETLTNGAKVTGQFVASSKIGVGIDSPAKPLHVFSAATDVVGRFESGDVGAGVEFIDATTTAQLKVDAGTLTINTDTAGAAADSNISLRVDATEKFNISEVLTVNKQNMRNNDNVKQSFGSGVDMEISHVSSNNVNTFQSKNNRTMAFNANSLLIGNQDIDEAYAAFTNGGSVDLYFNNGKKFETTNTGVEVTGDVDTDTLGVTGLATLGSSTVTGVSTTDTLVVDKDANGVAVEFKKDGTVCGAIRVSQSSGPQDITIGNGNVSLRYFNGSGVVAIAPYKMSDNSENNGNVDLGRANAQWDDIFSVNAVTTSSDRNVKQSIEELTEAETRVSQACKGLVRKFKWNSAVEKKGSEARYHFGVIAQDVQAAFTAEGLDAGDYGLFVSNTWEDESGVEQTRLGVRYTELLAFIIGGL